jgi:hypothetical protein
MELYPHAISKLQYPNDALHRPSGMEKNGIMLYHKLSIFNTEDRI